MDVVDWIGAVENKKTQITNIDSLKYYWNRW